MSQLLKGMTIQDVAYNLGVQWKTVKEIEKKKLQRKYKYIDYSNVKHIAIDEFAVKKGHVYQTVVMDLDSRQVLFVGKGRSESCLDKFWKKIKRQNVKIKAVAVDMWPAYLNSVINNSPDSIIVYDKFHIVKKLNEALSQTRKALFKQETLVDNKKILKGTRWLLLSRNENLSEKGKKKLEEAFEINKPLAQVYYLKEELTMLWKQKDKEEADDFLTIWCEQAVETKLQPVLKFVNMLKAHRSGILNWYNHNISTGPLEGMNNKIKVLKRKAYGYRDLEFFNLKILDLHTTRYALI